MCEILEAREDLCLTRIFQSCRRWLRQRVSPACVAGFFFAAATSSLIEKSSKERCDETDERGHCAHQHDGLPDDGVLLLLCGHIPAG